MLIDGEYRPVPESERTGTEDGDERRATVARTGNVRRLAPTGWARTARLVLWPLAVGSLLHLLVRSGTGTASDLAILWRSGASLVSGGPLYDPGLTFIYPPLSGWLFAPLGLLSFEDAVWVVVTVGLAAVVVATVLLLRLVGVPASSPVLPAVLLGLSHSRPLTGLLDQANIDTVLLLAEVGIIALLLARRDVAAGALLGAVCAVKPSLAPVALALVILGRGRAVAAAAVSGLVLSALGVLTVPDRGTFFTDILPLLAGGNREELAPFNRSIHGASGQLGLPPALEVVLRLAAFGVACWVAWRRRSGPVAPMEVVPLLMLGTVLASSFAWANYSLYLLPLLVTVARRDSLVRSWPAWAGVYLFATDDAWHIEDLAVLPDTLLRLLPLWGWLLLLVACAVTAYRSRPLGRAAALDRVTELAGREPRVRPIGMASRMASRLPRVDGLAASER